MYMVSSFPIAIGAGPGMFPWYPDQVRNDFVTALPGVLEIEAEDNGRRSIDFRFQLDLKRSPERIRDAYLSEVEFVDRALGDLLDKLGERGWLEKSVVVVVSDHGEALGEHGQPAHIEHLYDSMLRVPLILWGPGLLPAGLTVDSPVGLVDILPTIAALMDVDLPPGVRGRNLLPAIRGVATAESVFLSQTFRPEAKRDLVSLVESGFKIIGDTGASTYELFDLAGDPGEVEDLAARRKALAEVMAGRLALVLERSEQGSAVAAPIDEETRSQLRALGYEH